MVLFKLNLQIKFIVLLHTEKFIFYVRLLFSLSHCARAATRLMRYLFMVLSTLVCMAISILYAGYTYKCIYCTIYVYFIVLAALQ